MLTRPARLRQHVLWKQIRRRSHQDGIINCCSGKPVALADKVEEFIKEHNFKIKLNYGAFPDRPYDSPAVWGSREKIDIILKNCGEL